MGALATLGDIVRASIALGVESDPLTSAERDLIEQHRESETSLDAEALGQEIRDGGDPLGDAYAAIVSPEQRRPLGQTYTPVPIIDAMLAWASRRPTPGRIVDPGAGSGRYLLAAAKAFPDAKLIALEIDALSALMLRANIRASGLSDRSEVMVGDYREAAIPVIEEPTLYIGNPPYVRHHQIEPEWKDWLTETALRHGYRASKLAGLHIHFFLATAEHAREGDFGAFITSSEWLDVNYGSLLRELLLDSLGGTEIHVLDPSAAPFADATTTGAITCFEIGTKPSSLRLRRVETIKQLAGLGLGAEVSRARLVESSRWSVLMRTAIKVPTGHIELGELCRVHRGTVTGANRVWVARAADVKLPETVLFPSVTKALELFSAGERLIDVDPLRRVIDLPVDLDVLSADDRKLVDRFLRTAKPKVKDGYVAANRKAWWSVGLRQAAPVLATYMARRPPAFVLNDGGARHINIAHGLYPRETLARPVLEKLADYLRTAVTLSQGRTYAGGLTKFEPREMERLTVPNLDQLAAEAEA